MSTLRQRGSTYLELIFVITFGAGVMLLAYWVMHRTMDGFLSFTRFSDLAYVGDTSMGRLSLDLRQAVPSSVRVTTSGSVTALEFLHVLDVGQYRLTQTGGAAGNPLSFTPADNDTQFDVLGQLAQRTSIVTGAGANDCVNGTADCLVTANGVGGADAYNRDNLATITAVGNDTASDGSDQVSFNNAGFSSGVVFPQQSSDQWFHVVDTPVSYLCDTSSGTLRRYDEYTITASQAGVDTHAELLALANPASYALVADNITACAFTVTGSPRLVSARIAMNYGAGQVVFQEAVALRYRP